MVVFVALCEGFLRTNPHFDLFLNFFKAALVKPTDGVAPWGFLLHSDEAEPTWGILVGGTFRIQKGLVPVLVLLAEPRRRPTALLFAQPCNPNRGTHALVVGSHCRQRGLDPHLDCISCLRRYGLTWHDIIEAYYRRRVTPAHI